MLTDQAWQVAYPRKEYITKSERALQCTLHFLIALDQPVEAIQTYINNNKEKAFYKLKAADPWLHGVRPLHLAAMKGNLAIVQALLGVYKEEKSLPMLIDAQDGKGWTALHFARLTSPEIYDALIAEKAAATLRTSLGATAEDLDLWIGRKVIQTSLSTTILDLPGVPKRLFSEIGSEELQKLTKLKRVIDRCIYPQNQWQALWVQKPASAQGTLLKDFFLKCNDHFPKLILRPNEALQKVDPHCLELIAGEKIEKHRVVCVLSGLITEKLEPCQSFPANFSPPHSEHIYQCEKIKPDEEGGVWRWMNSGWPNLLLFTAQGVQGASVEFFVATETIPEDSRLFWDYGPSMYSLGWGRYQLLFERTRMRDWFKPGISQVVQKLNTIKKSNDQSLSKLIDYRAMKERLFYPLGNPAALLDLIFSEATPLKDWDSFLHSKDPIASDWVQRYLEDASLIVFFMQYLQVFEDSLVAHPALKKKVQAWILDSIGTYTVMQLIKAIEEIGKQCRSGMLTVQNWERVKEEMDTTLPNYQWLDDENAPMGIQRRRQFFLKSCQERPESIPQLRTNLQRLLEGGLSEEHEAVKTLRWVLSQLSV